MNYIDTETYCEVPIKHGTSKYTRNCECMIATYALGDDAPVQLWDATMGTPMPADLDYILNDDDELLYAHNAMFDRNVLRWALKRDIRIERWRCSMVRALAHGLPGGLDILCQIFNVPFDLAKHKDGKALINLFCKPQPANRKLKRATRETHPEEWQKFCDYAISDVTAMREIIRKLPEWNYRGFELSLWHLDQRINDRGVAIDTDFAREAIRVVADESGRLRKQTGEATNGEVESATKRDLLLAYLAMAFGIELPDMQKSTLERRIGDPDLPLEFRELLALRLDSSSNSTSKYKTLINATDDDGRLRCALQYDGAARTRRWAGRVFQPQNLVRPDMKFSEIELGIQAIKLGVEHLI